MAMEGSPRPGPRLGAVQVASFPGDARWLGGLGLGLWAGAAGEEERGART